LTANAQRRRARRLLQPDLTPKQIARLEAIQRQKQVNGESCH
jgi:hypothetical protein